MTYRILKYDGPPCRDHCGYFGPFRTHLTFFTLEESLQWLLNNVLLSKEFDNYIISEDETLGEVFFSYPWIESKMPNKPSLVEFIHKGTWSENTKDIIRRVSPVIDSYYESQEESDDE